MKLELKGFRKLERALAEELPKATAKNALRGAAKDAMGLVETRAKQLVPVEKGNLRDSITTKTAKAKRAKGSVRFERSTGVEVWTGPSGKHPEGSGNPAWQEFGTVKQTAQPYMRPAADEEGQRVIDDVRGFLAERIGKARSRIAKKAAKGK